MEPELTELADEPATMRPWLASDLGVYVHIPFCATRCDYCAFATWTDRAHLIDDYLDACVTDVTRRRAERTSSPRPPRSTSAVARRRSFRPTA